MTDAAPHLRPTPMLDFETLAIQTLIHAKGWRALSEHDRIGAAYDFVRNAIRFGYNSDDTLPASAVLRDRYGQCNTKASLLMALLRALRIPCRLHGFTIDKSLQRGVIPEAVYPLAPHSILHSWVDVLHNGAWISLEGFILDEAVLNALQAAFPGRDVLCAYGAGTDRLQSPAVVWRGVDTFIQRTGINRDLGLFDSPDAFYAEHRQAMGMTRAFLYRNVIRHWMNRRVSAIRAGKIPAIPDAPRTLVPGFTRQ